MLAWDLDRHGETLPVALNLSLSESAVCMVRAVRALRKNLDAPQHLLLQFLLTVSLNIPGMLLGGGNVSFSLQFLVRVNVLSGEHVFLFR